MNIVRKKELVFDTIDTIKASIAMFNGKIITEYNHISLGQYTILFKFNELMKIQFDLYSNFISILTFCRKYEASHLKKLYNEINATPKEIYNYYGGTTKVYHYFKISKANTERLYNMFIVMARF